MKALSHKTHKALYLISSALLFLTLGPYLASAGQFKIARVDDGDTVKTIGHDSTIKLGLVGIDALLYDTEESLTIQESKGEV
jgi:endonuclease YncB( thermonuclease family)